MSNNTKDLMQGLDRAKARGWAVSKTSGNHYQCRWPYGGPCVYTSSTPSDWREIRNLEGKWKRIEREFPAPIKIKPQKKEPTMTLTAPIKDFVKQPETRFWTNVRYDGKQCRFSMPDMFINKRFSVILVDRTIVVSEDAKGPKVAQQTYGNTLHIGKKVLKGLLPFTCRAEVAYRDGGFEVSLPDEAIAVQIVAKTPASTGGGCFGPIIQISTREGQSSGRSHQPVL
jgi:hypothetical protein